MSTTLQVQVRSDHLERLASARSPIAAIAELIWNSVDADAHRVSVMVKRNLLGGIESISVTDDGTGMRYDATLDAFASLGGSRKRDGGRSPGGRMLHGRLGKGRFKAFALGTEVEWNTAYIEDGRLLSYRVFGARENLSSFLVEDRVSAEGTSTGTRVAITGIQGTPRLLETDTAVEHLTGEFALYLRQYPDVRIEYNGKLLDPAKVVLKTADLPITVINPETSESLDGMLTVIEWGIDVERALYLCDSNGLTLARLPIGIHAPGFAFTAYLKSEVVRKAEQDGTLELEALAPGLASLVESCKSTLRKYFRDRESQKAATLVDAWKSEEVYPYENEPKDPVQRVERQVFDVVALSVHSYLPDFEGADPSSKRLTFRLIRQALESDASSLQTILQDVLGLPPDKQDELARLLKRTSLAAIITASRIVANRLDFLRGLESLVFNDPSRDQLRERDQLHRIVADNTWLFGEEFSLAVDDQGLTEVLKAHCEQLGIAVLDNSPVTRVDGSRGIVDLMLSRVVPMPRADQREHLVVELKRPTVRIGQEELAQVESYAHAIIRDERFRNTQTTWHFWALSNDVDDIVAEKAEQPGQPEGLVTQLDRGRAKVWVRTWAQVLRGCSARLQFFQDKLNLRVDRDNGLEYLRETYSKYLPPSTRVEPS